MSGSVSYDELSQENNYEPSISINIPSLIDNHLNTSFDFDLNEPFQVQHGDSNFLNNHNNNSESSFSLTNGLLSNSSSLNKIIIGIKRGRKSKDDKRPANHTKFSPDNLIKKIKTALMKHINDKLNKNRRFTPKKFLKISKKINEYIKKEYNINLMEMTIREIYEGNMLQKIYDEEIRDNKMNSSLIEEIYYRNKDIETIKILNTKFIDFLNQSDTKENICQIIKRKELKKHSIEDVEFYMNYVRQYLENFEFWFKRKPDRNYKPRNKKPDEEK